MVEDPEQRKTASLVGPAACRAPGNGSSFTLGTPTQNSATAEGDVEPDGELPFATTLGNAVAFGGAYWVTAIDNRQKESHAVLAQIEQSVDGGVVFDLGRVYGDVEPPRVVVSGEQVLVVVPDSDASGKTLKLGRLSTRSNRGRVEWFDTVLEGVDDSPVFSVVTNGKTTLLAWDVIDPSTRRGVVRWRTYMGADFRTATVGSTPKPTPKGKVAPTERLNADASTSEEIDAEAPQLINRASGFWLGYLALELPKDPKKKKAHSGRDKVGADETAAEPPVVDLGQRGIHLLPLDSSGTGSGRPIAVTVPGAHVVAFDVEALPDGGAIVAYRDAISSPGVEEDVLELAEVHPDGRVSRLRIEDERLGGGAPLLFGASASNAVEAVWVMVAGKSGEMQVTSYRANATQLEPLVGDPLLVGAEPLLRNGATLLVGRTQGRLVEIERLDCRFDVDATVRTSK